MKGSVQSGNTAGKIAKCLTLILYFRDGNYSSVNGIISDLRAHIHVFQNTRTETGQNIAEIAEGFKSTLVQVERLESRDAQKLQVVSVPTMLDGWK